MGRKKNSSNPFSLLSFQDIIMSVSGIFIFLTLLLALDLVSRVIGTSPYTKTVKTRESMDEIKKEVETLKSQIDLASRTIEANFKIQKEYLNFSREDIKQKITGTLKQKSELTAELEKLKNEKADLTEKQSQIPDIKKTIAEIDQKTDQLKKEKSEIESKTESLQNLKSNVFVRSGSHREIPWLVDLAHDRISVFSLKEDIAKHFSKARDFIRWARKHDPQREYFMLYIRPSSTSFYEEIRDSLKESGFKIGLDLMPEEEKIIITSGGNR